VLAHKRFIFNVSVHFYTSILNVSFPGESESGVAYISADSITKGSVAKVYTRKSLQMQKAFKCKTPAKAYINRAFLQNSLHQLIEPTNCGHFIIHIHICMGVYIYICMYMYICICISSSWHYTDTHAHIYISI